MIALMKNTVARIISLALIVLFTLVGVIGIVMPVIPGIVFLIIAALIASRHFPALAFVLEQNRFSARCMRISDSFMDLGWWDKSRLFFWGTAKITMDGLVWCVALLKKGARLSLRK